MDRKILLTIGFLFFALLIKAGEITPAKSDMPPTTTTQVQAALCGQTLAALDTPIVANIVSGAASYRFRVTTTLPESMVPVQVVTSATRSFKLIQLTNYAFGRVYSVEVAVLYGGVWQPYGPACSVSSPTPTTVIQSAYCGLTVASISDPVYANSVPYAQGYRFRVTNLLDSSDMHILDRTIREFRLNLFQVSSGATYLVEVAVKNFDGTYLPYGPLCSVTCPVLYTKVMASYCGRTLGAFSDYIYADLVEGCSGYRFKITNMSNLSDVQYLDRPIRQFSMSMLTNVQYNTAYKVEISIKDTHGDYLPYGPFCTLFTPLLPVPKIQLSQCELVGPLVTELMYADEYPNATMYRFRLENLMVGYSHHIDRWGRSYSLSMFSGLLPNTPYTVKVAVKVNGVWTDYGKACDVTTPASFPSTRFALNDNKTDDTDTSFMPKLYPNPFSDYFSIDATLQATAEVSVRIYDMTGRLLDSQRIPGSELLTMEMGRNFPPGVYNVVMKVNDEVKTLRVIKR
jgi:hypothetical protein